MMKASDFKPGAAVKAKSWWRGPYAPCEGVVREVKGDIIWVDYEGDPFPEHRQFEAFELDLLTPVAEVPRP